MSEQNKDGYNYDPDHTVDIDGMTKPEVISALYNYAIKATEQEKSGGVEGKIGATELDPETVDMLVREKTGREEFFWNGSNATGTGQLFGGDVWLTPGVDSLTIPVNLDGSIGLVYTVDYDDLYGKGAARQALEDFRQKQAEQAEQED